MNMRAFKFNNDMVKTNRLTIGEMTGVRKVSKAGIFGVELECETLRNIEFPNLSPIWQNHADGSLRGNSTEYVLNGPISYEATVAAVTKMFDSFNKNKVVLNDSNRTSLHVHLNAYHWYVNRVCAFASLWYIYEDLLTHYCGNYRVGNLFCLRGKDAVGQIESFTRLAISDDGLGYFREGNRYAALNAHSLNKFGSIEIRTMRGLTNQADVIEWIDILHAFYLASEEFESNPQAIFEEFSNLGPVEFLRILLGGELYNSVIRKLGWTEDQVSDSAYEGMRLAQPIAYSYDWSNFGKVRPDPFQRKQRPVQGNRDEVAPPVALYQRPIARPIFNPNEVRPNADWVAYQFRNPDNAREGN